MKIEEHNRAAWDRQVEAGSRWTLPVSAREIERARGGDWSVVLTPTKPVPRDWLGEVADREILCLASGGGQQAPLLAAAGARVTVLDNSPRQLARDREVMERDGLALRLELGVMADLSRFADARFDLVFHPVSNVFAPDLEPVWREAYRVLRPGGVLLAGITNPLVYLFDWAEHETSGRLVLRFSLPYSDAEHLPRDQLEARVAAGEPMEFGHTLEAQIGGQLAAGFVLIGFYEDVDPELPLAAYAPTFIATRARKPAGRRPAGRAKPIARPFGEPP